MTVATALATFSTPAMAIFTAWMAYETRKAARETKRSVDKETETVERSKDDLMPVLSIEWIMPIRPQSDLESPEDVFGIALKNIGPGPAFLHEITTREEVSRSSIYHHAIRTAIVPAGGHESATFKRTQSLDMSRSAISSVSVWYTDVYGRWYRTRLVFQYLVGSQTQGWFGIRPWVTEFRSAIAEPSFADRSITNPNPKNDVRRCEQGRLVRVSTLEYPDLHTLKARDRVKEAGLLVPTTPIADSHSVHICDISWWFGQSRPEVHLQILKDKPFVLGVRDGRDDASDVAVIIDAPLLASFSTSNPPPLPNPIEADQLDGWGLRNSVSVGNDLLELHGLAIKAIRAHLSPD